MVRKDRKDPLAGRDMTPSIRVRRTRPLTLRPARGFASGMRVALVTGGGSGIGRACALALAKAGFATVVTGRRPDALEATVAAIAAAGGTAFAVPADITRPESVQALFAAVKRLCRPT